jgi:hypothetical protein
VDRLTSLWHPASSFCSEHDSELANPMCRFSEEQLREL